MSKFILVYFRTKFYFNSAIFKLIWGLNMNFAKPPCCSLIFLKKKFRTVITENIGRHINMC
jgi:hypothetical protein